MFARHFRCFICGARYPMSKTFACKCGGSLDIEYDYAKLRTLVRKVMLPSLRPHARISHWKYWPFYPIRDLKHIITLGEGGTDLVRSVRIEKLLNKKIGKRSISIWFKNETTNPTGSFKDRGSSVEISKALELGAQRLVCATTGNMGASVAAYATRAALPVKIFVPANTPSHKLAQIASHGASIVKVKGDYDIAAARAARLADHYYLAGDYPYRGEGEKSIGFEIADQFHFKLPDVIVVPMGNGTMAWAIYKAFHELVRVRLIQKIPKLIGVQAAGCAPIVRAFEQGIDGIKQRIVPVKPRTVASAIAVGNPIDGPEALAAIARSGGFAIAVSDKEILAARELLGREGIYAEPAGAAATAGLLASMKRSKWCEQLSDAREIVILVTGHGLKG